MVDDEFIQHVTKHLGKPRPKRYSHSNPKGSQIAIHVIESEANGKILVTEGMSFAPMNVPDGQEEFQFAELMMRLKSDWPVSEESLCDPQTSWPFKWLLRLASYPHEHQTWLGGPLLFLDNEDPPQPLAPGVGFTCWMLIEGREPYGHWSRHDGTDGVLYEVFALYPEERNLQRDEGFPVLMQRLNQFGIPQLLYPGRLNTCSPECEQALKARG